ncbi:MAG: Hpt domain-containing protein, partial [Myxococcales bacterium]|nr:Hpt domain-containing protein [Myxococcales bacterium]
LLECLGGFLEGTRVLQASEGDSQRDTALPTDGPLISRLAANPKLQPTLARFAARLGDKLGEMDVALSGADFGALAELAHWLKGAAGTVGFDDFTNPAAGLEQAALQSKAHECESLMQELHGLAERIVVEPEVAPSPGEEPAPVPQGEIVSRFAEDPRFAGVLARFRANLDTRLAEAEKAASAGRQDELAAFAHWLKGSAGTVGYDALSRPAERLEALARGGAVAECPALVSEIRVLCEKLR